MKKRRLIVWCVIIISLVVPIGSAQAYFASSSKNNKECWAMQWLGKQETGTTGKAADAEGQNTEITYKAFATRTFCTNKLNNPTKITKSSGIGIDGATEVGSGASAVGGFTINTTSNNKGIKVTKYTGDKPTESKTFKLSDYNNSFKKLTSAIESYLPNSLTNVRSLGEVTMSISKYTANKKLTTEVLNEMETKAEKEKWGTSDNENGSSDSSGTGDVTQTCSNMGGAQSLGWIVCPVLTLMGNAAESIYNKYVEPALQVDPKLFTAEQSNLEEAWGTFQNFANIIFVILLLLVIFSQLTGVGIDNYGIKKILPKLIVSAILINLSYIICTIAVDLSNILGNGFQALFDGMADGLKPSLTVEDSNLSGKAIASTGGSLAVLGVLGALVLMSGSIWEAPSVVLSLLVAALGLFVGIFFLFILLAGREAAIVVLTVISPVAIVCYMLPNTKKMFDKWLNAFKGLLLVYPICGLLVGGGNYVSSLLLSSGMNNGFFSALTAMVVGILPIFFIPMLIKNSFAALGNIGARISGFGDRMRGGVTRRAENSNTYKNAQERANRWTNRARAGVDAEGNPIQMGRFRRAIRGGNRNIAMSRANYLRDRSELNAQNRLNSDQGMMAAIAGIDDKASSDRVSDAEAMLTNGRVSGVNVNNPDDMKTYHAGALARLANAKNDQERDVAFAEVRAAQNIMSKTDKGRENIGSNIQTAVMSGQTAGLDMAASHLMSAYGDTYKSKNRGEHAMIQDLASGRSMSDVANKINNVEYAKAGTDKYTAETLSAADESAINNLISSMGAMTTTERANIQSTARLALDKGRNGNLNIKPEVAAKLQQITNWSGPPTPPKPPTP